MALFNRKKKQPQNSLKIPELLAPAGGFEQLRYAIYFGADAVYLACDRFGLRQRAKNFSLVELPHAVKMAHDAGVRVYVTLNAFLHDEDFAGLEAYIRALDSFGVDAVIVSDLGMIAAVREYAPTMEVHVSTQASVSNVAAARMWQAMGAKRIVCAREMTLTEIAAMKAAMPEMELEVFVQGAMCMSISGRCLISDYLAGRPANQGHCVQPCRWNYRLEEESRPGQYFPIEEDGRGTYIMNSKDLNMLSHLDDLMKAGVDSIKIEGRMKKAYYVATVVNAYRHVLDGESPEKWQTELNCISHRPYSTGFFYGKPEQSVEDDIYVQLYDWVAEVIESQPLGGDTWRTLVYCRNRFYEGDKLELLSPHIDVLTVPVEGLQEVFLADGRGEATDERFFAEGDVLEESFYEEKDKNLTASEVAFGATPLGPELSAIPVEVANKAMGTYAFVTSVPLERFDILRAMRRDPSRKN